MIQAGKILLLLGLLLAVVGILLLVLAKLGVQEFPLGNLPGDIRIKKGNSTFFFPLTSCLLVSGVITVISIVWKKFF